MQTVPSWWETQSPIIQERSNELIQRLLTFARPGKGPQKMMAFSEVIKEVVDLCKETFPAEINIVEDSTPGLATVYSIASGHGDHAMVDSVEAEG